MAKDINRNADKNSNENWGAIPIQGKAKKIGAISPADPIKAIGTGGEATVMYPIRNANGMKGKFLAKTNQFGITQEGRITKTFGWGLIIGLGGIILFKKLQKKGYIKLPSFK